jgi:hypothetical protein
LEGENFHLKSMRWLWLQFIYRDAKNDEVLYYVEVLWNILRMALSVRDHQWIEAIIVDWKIDHYFSETSTCTACILIPLGLSKVIMICNKVLRVDQSGLMIQKVVPSRIQSHIKIFVVV